MKCNKFLYEIYLFTGWKVPVSTLLERGLLDPECDFPLGLSNFFSQSCIPGIKDKSFDPEGLVPESLCGLCPRESKYRNYNLNVIIATIRIFYFISSKY